MNHTIKHGAVLMAALLLCLMPALALAAAPGAPAHHYGAGLLWILVAGLGLAGTVSLTYNTMPSAAAPTLGGTVPPTAAQAANLNILTVAAFFAETDTSIAIVHNWGLSAAQIAAGFPLVWPVTITGGGTVVPGLTAYSSAANTLTVTKISAAGSAGSLTFTLLRPHSLMQ